MHCAVGVLGEAFGKAGRGAGRVVAVEALQLAEYVFAIDLVLVHHGPFVFAGATVGITYRKVAEGLLGLGQVVDLVAGFFTLAAADATGCVVQHPVAVSIIWKGVRASLGDLGRAKGRDHACASHNGQKCSAFHILLHASRRSWERPYGRWCSRYLWDARHSYPCGNPCTADGRRP